MMARRPRETQELRFPLGSHVHRGLRLLHHAHAEEGVSMTILSCQTWILESNNVSPDVKSAPLIKSLFFGNDGGTLPQRSKGWKRARHLHDDSLLRY